MSADGTSQKGGKQELVRLAELVLQGKDRLYFIAYAVLGQKIPAIANEHKRSVGEVEQSLLTSTQLVENAQLRSAQGMETSEGAGATPRTTTPTNGPLPDDVCDVLCAVITEHPDWLYPEVLAAVRAATGRGVTNTTVGVYRKKLGIPLRPRKGKTCVHGRSLPDDKRTVLEQICGANLALRARAVMKLYRAATGCSIGKRTVTIYLTRAQVAAATAAAQQPAPPAAELPAPPPAPAAPAVPAPAAAPVAIAQPRKPTYIKCRYGRRATQHLPAISRAFTGLFSDHWHAECPVLTGRWIVEVPTPGARDTWLACWEVLPGDPPEAGETWQMYGEPDRHIASEYYHHLVANYPTQETT
jgi:hypothetical protein